MAVIALVQRIDVKSLRQLGRYPKPVVSLPEQTVQQHEWFALAELFKMQLHRQAL